MGTGKFLKEKEPEVKIIGVEPTKGHKIQGLKNMEESIVPKIYNPRALDEKIIVEDDEVFEKARLLVEKKGLFVGKSSGVVVAWAKRIAKDMDHGIIVRILLLPGWRSLLEYYTVLVYMCKVPSMTFGYRSI